MITSGLIAQQLNIFITEANIHEQEICKLFNTVSIK